MYGAGCPVVEGSENSESIVGCALKVGNFEPGGVWKDGGKGIQGVGGPPLTHIFCIGDSNAGVLFFSRAGEHIGVSSVLHTGLSKAQQL